MYSSCNASKSETVVSNARQAREERAEYRRREVAALIIQSTARGFLTRHAVGQRWRKELDHAIGRNKEGKTSTNKSFSSNISADAKSALTATTSTLDKISLHSKQLSQKEWQFASFGSNTLTGAYGSLLSGNKKGFSNESNECASTINESSETVTNSKGDVTSKNAENNSEKSSPIPNDGAKSNPTNQDMLKLIKNFLFVFEPKKDQQRFLDLMKYLLKNTESELSSKYSYVHLCLHKQYVLQWILQVKAILWKCCKYIDMIENFSENQAVSVYLCALFTLTDVSHWPSLKKQTTLHGALQQICLSIIADLHNRGALNIIGTLLKRGITSILTNNLVAMSITFIFRLIKTKEISQDQVLSIIKCLIFLQQNHLLSRIVTLLHGEDACYKYKITSETCQSIGQVTDVLSILANIVHLCTIEEASMKEKQNEIVVVLNSFLKFLGAYSISMKSSSNTWHPVLGYFSGNKVENAQIEAMPTVKQQLEHLWSPAFVRLVFHDILTLPSFHDDTTTPVPAEQITSKQKPKVKLANKLGSYLKKLSPSHSRKILLPTGGRKLEYSEVRNTCSSCVMYRRALSVLTKQIQLEMLTGLTFMNDLLCRMWRFICELGPSGGFELFLSSVSLPPEMSEPYFAVFTLFCDMTSHILSILDDVEFYEQQIPFHLEELVIISAALRQFAYRMIWSGAVTDSNSEMFWVFDSAHTLLMMLYDRDSRRSFTPPLHWLCKDIKPSSVLCETTKSPPRAKFVLQKIPFVLPHKDRVIHFRHLVAQDKETLSKTDQQYICIRRSSLVENGYQQLANIPINALKGVVRVRFKNDLGLDEAGIDQDGVFKEFLEEFIKKVFNPDMSLFKVTTGEEVKLYPSPLSYMVENHLSWYTFIGKMLGKAVYEGIVLDVPFANFFLRTLLANQHSKLYSPIDELPSLDAEFYKNLTWIKRYDGDISDLGLTFTYEEDVMGKVESHELVHGGSAIPVTNDNRFMYIHTLALYRMHTQIREQSRAFVAGFRSLIPHSWTSMFSAPELQRLISGDNVDLDLSDLKRHVVYYGGFHSSHRVVKWLWDVLERDYSAQDRASFLKFVTSCSRPPLLGFAHLSPQFSIRCVEVADEEDTGDTVATVLRGFFRLSSANRNAQRSSHRLPTASTCFNLLKLPNYPSKDVLREKLKQAIANNTGFELS